MIILFYDVLATALLGSASSLGLKNRTPHKNTLLN
jgi:hypothetical protein